MLTTTNLNSAITPRRNQLQILLARHRKSVFGQAFVGDLTAENMSTYRSSTLLEVLMSTLLYYLRSFYPNLGHVQVRAASKLLVLTILRKITSKRWQKGAASKATTTNWPSFILNDEKVFSSIKERKMIEHINEIEWRRKNIKDPKTNHTTVESS